MDGRKKFFLIYEDLVTYPHHELFSGAGKKKRLDTFF